MDVECFRFSLIGFSTGFSVKKKRPYLMKSRRGVACRLMGSALTAKAHLTCHPGRFPGSWIVLPAASSQSIKISDRMRLSFPLTVAGPQRICTAFPVGPNGHPDEMFFLQTSKPKQTVDVNGFSTASGFSLHWKKGLAKAGGVCD